MCIGWLMGYHPNAVKEMVLELDINSFRFLEYFTVKPFKEYDVEIRVQAIRISKTEMIDWKAATTVVHIHVHVVHSTNLLTRLLKIFSRKNEFGFLLGQE